MGQCSPICRRHETIKTELVYPLLYTIIEPQKIIFPSQTASFNACLTIIRIKIFLEGKKYMYVHNVLIQIHEDVYSKLNFQGFIKIVNRKRGTEFCQSDVGNRH